MKTNRKKEKKSKPQLLQQNCRQKPPGRDLNGFG